MFKKGIDELEMILDEKGTAPDIWKAIIGSLNDIQIGNLPHQYTFGCAHFGHVFFSLSKVLSVTRLTLAGSISFLAIGV